MRFQLVDVRVNSTTAGPQDESAISLLPAGADALGTEAVVVYTSPLESDPTGSEIFAAIVDADSVSPSARSAEP